MTSIQDAAAIYIPADRRHALAQGISLPVHTSGAALFADISGFTPLTEALTKSLGSQRGAEELPCHLNRVYDALIAQIDAYGGSVIGFAGDAITCWFNRNRDEDGSAGSTAMDDQGNASLRATACGLAIQQAMQAFASVTIADQLPVRLAIKVAIASGAAQRFLVGNPEIQFIDTLAGATLARMAAAEKIAGPGEVVVDAQTATDLGECAAIGEWRSAEHEADRFALVNALREPVPPSPWPELPPAALREDQVSPWVLPPVYKRMQAGLGEFITELRPAVALFLRFSGIDYDDDTEAGHKLDGYIRWVQGIVTRYEGTLIQLTIGDKGNYLYAAFGAPIAHEDDSRRAVNAALELLNPPTHLSFISRVQMGITRGIMRTGSYGGITRRTYGALGDEVNLAARLMQNAALGQVLVSKHVRDEVKEEFTWEALPAIRVKGKASLIPVYHPTRGQRKESQASLASRPARPLVGRAEECAVMAQQVQQLVAGVGSVVIIEGEAGMGKSRLAYELQRYAVRARLKTLSGAGDSVEKSTPYYAWRSIIAQMFDLDRLEDQLAQRQHFLDSLGQFVSAEGESDLLCLAPLLNVVLPFNIPDNEFTLHLEGKERADATRQVLTRLLENSAGRSPTVILLDNAHWLDSLSWELAVYLTRILMASGNLLMGIVTRPLDQDSAGARHLQTLEALGAAVGTEAPRQSAGAFAGALTPKPCIHLSLSALNLEETVAVAAARLELPASSLPEPLAQLVRQLAEGNPFFAEELVLMLRDQGLIHIEPAPTPATEGQEVEEQSKPCSQPKCCSITGDLSPAVFSLPHTIGGLILARMDCLLPESQLTLKVASVLGRVFEYAPLSHVLKIHTDMGVSHLDRQLYTLMSLDLIQSQALKPDSSGRKRTTFIFKQIITQEIAYQTLLFAQRKQFHQAIARWYETTFPDQLDHLAGLLAHHYTLAGEDEPALGYLVRAGEAARRLYANHEAVAHFNQALQVAARLSPEKSADQRMVIHTGMGELLTITGQYEPALEHLHTALGMATDAGRLPARADVQPAFYTRLQARACRWLARAHELRGEYPPALDWIQRGLEALSGQETEEAAELLLLAGLIHTRQGDYEQALRQCQAGLGIAEKLNEVSVLARSYTLLGFIPFLRGDSAIAIEHFQHANDLYRRAGNIQGQATSHNQMANAYFNIGQWQAAKYHYTRAYEIFDRMGDIYHCATTDNNLGGIALNQGRLDEALALYQKALHALERIGGSVWVLGMLHMNLGDTFIRQGDIEAAHQHLRASQGYFEQAQSRDFLPELHRHLAEADLAAGKLAGAETQAGQALDLARELAMRGEEGNALRVLGQVAMAQGQPAQAYDHLGKSVSILGEVKNEYEGARSQLGLAQLHADQRKYQDALAAIEHCAPIFERLGAAPEATIARALREHVIKAARALREQAVKEKSGCS